MKSNQRVVKSIPDRSNNPYTKTSAGGRARMQAAANYMDEREHTQLYSYERNELVVTDRHQAAARIEDTETRYQQHMAFTTAIASEAALIQERALAERVARSIQERRPDAEIYAIAVHSDGKGEEKDVHVHVILGTQTTLRRDDLTHFREEAYKIEQLLEQENTLELSDPEREWIRERQAERAQEAQETWVRQRELKL